MAKIEQNFDRLPFARLVMDFGQTGAKMTARGQIFDSASKKIIFLGWGHLSATSMLGSQVCDRRYPILADFGECLRDGGGSPGKSNKAKMTRLGRIKIWPKRILG